MWRVFRRRPASPFGHPFALTASRQRSVASLDRPRSSSSTPIALPDFIHALSAALERDVRADGIGAPLVIALSGGIDSMVLTELLYQTVQEIPQPRHTSNCHGRPCCPPLTAIIIDHGARQVSADEARLVAQHVRSRYSTGDLLQVQVRQLDFMHSVGSNSAGIEQLAREARYQALGAACRDVSKQWWNSGSSAGEADTPSAYLLTAHHASDQAEELLMRLARYRPSLFSLQGIPPRSTIPCCGHIWGVHRSGGRSPRRVSQPFLLSADGTGGTGCPPTTIPDVPIETGGVRLVRPLLPFSKDRLAATAAARALAHVTDETNRDVTYTLRNAARWLLSASDGGNNETGSARPLLPRALRPESLLALGRAANARKAAAEQAVAARIDGVAAAPRADPSRVKLLAFLPAAGVLLVQFPAAWEQSPEALQRGSGTDDCWSPLETVLLVKMLVGAVSPVGRIETSHLRAAAGKIRDGTASSPFTAAGVLFMPLPSTAPTEATVGPLGGRKWVLVRAPPSRREAERAGGPVAISPAGEEPSFSMFDSRFWISATTATATVEGKQRPPLQSSFASKKQLQELFKDGGFKASVASLDRLLEAAGAMPRASARAVREVVLKTIPAIKMAGSAGGEEEEVVAVPGIGWYRSTEGDGAAGPKCTSGLRFHLRYRSVDRRIL